MNIFGKNYSNIKDHFMIFLFCNSENGEPLPIMKVEPGGGKVKYSTIVFPDKEKEKEKG